MAITDRSRLKKVFVALLASNEGDMTSTALAAVAAEANRSYKARVTDAGTAATGTAESPFARVKNAGLVSAINVVVPTSVAADNTDYITWTVGKSTAGAARVTIATGTTQISGLGAMTSFTAFPLTLSATAANLQVAAGDVLCVTVAKAGSGKAYAAATTFGSVDVDIEEN